MWPSSKLFFLMHYYISRKWTNDEYTFKCPDAWQDPSWCFLESSKKENRRGWGFVPSEITFAGFIIIPFFMLIGVFNQWIYLYLKLRSNCGCNCSAPVLTTVRIQTKTHCEWPKVPRYPLHQHTCSRFPLGIAWRRVIRFWITLCQPYLEKGVGGAFSPLLQEV